MPLPAPIGTLLEGLWRIDYRPSGPDICLGLDVHADPKRGNGFVVELVQWHDGRLGCDSCSSTIARNELTADQPAANSPVRLTGQVPRNQPNTWTDVQLTIDVASGNLARQEQV